MSAERHVQFGKEEGKTKEEMYQWDIVDEEGDFQKIPKTQLKVDPTYQRDVKSQQKVLEMAQRWSWARCGVIKVARRQDGSLYVFDGQHRVLAALKRASVKKLPCMVWDYANLKEEARAFLDCNLCLSHPRSYQTFKAGLVAENPLDLSVQTIIGSQGYSISGGNGRMTVSCISALRRTVKLDPDAASDAFALAVKIADGDAIPADIYQGLFHLIRQCRKLKTSDPCEPQFASRLCLAGNKGCLRSIQESKAAFLRGGERICAHGLWKVCNKGIRKNNQMKWEEKGA